MTFLKLANVQIVPNVAWLSLLGTMVAVTASASSACSNSPAPPEQAFVSALIGPGTLDGVNDSSACGQGDISWTLGNPVSPKPVLYANGSAQVGGAVSINCSVDQNGNGYNLQLGAELDGPMGGTLFVTGMINATGMSTGLSGSFTSMGQNFLDHNCTFTQSYNNGPLPMGGGPATGRAWGHIECDHAADMGQQGLGADGGEITRTCEASADFLFENCQ